MTKAPGAIPKRWRPACFIVKTAFFTPRKSHIIFSEDFS